MSFKNFVKKKAPWILPESFEKSII